MISTEHLGLSSAEVIERQAKGLVNRTSRSDWADYRTIASRHLFTLFNLMVVPAAVVLFSLGEWRAGVAVSGMMLVNTVVGLIQEVRAKRQLDKLAILTETKSHVVRDGQTAEIAASEIVLGDSLLLHSGDAVAADGVIVEANFLEVDESLLTGESDPSQREAGQRLISGSICVAGECVYRVDKVGKEAFAQSISIAARRYTSRSSPMMRTVNMLITFLSITAVALVAIYLVLYFFNQIGLAQLLKMIASTITSTVPQGLVLIMTVSFTVGAVVMSRRGVLVQRINAVEAMASINVICTDKTGTLTTNRLVMAQLLNQSMRLDDREVSLRLAQFANATIDHRNRSIQALRTALGEAKVELLDQIPFKSKNRFSAVRIRVGQEERLLVLGAPEAFSAEDQRNLSGVTALQTQGLRILVFAEVVAGDSAKKAFTDLMPQPLEILAIVALADELRPEAAKVLTALSAQGISFKVLSGDNPETIRATVAPLDLPLSREAVLTGDDWATAPDRAMLVEKHSVFGRVGPQQKVEIVDSLRQRGHYVAMIGDGINDVLPIKRADLGIAMGEGTQAAKTVSSLVLENNDFAMLPETIEEGRTIVRNLRRAAKLFLLKNVYSLILILIYAVGLLSLPFPYVPQQVTLLDWLVIGVPTFIIALTRARSQTVSKVPFLRDVGGFALRSGVVFALAGFVVLAFAKHIWMYDERTQRTLLLTVLIMLGITAIFRILDDGARAGDARLRLIALAGIPFYALMMYWPMSSRFFELSMLTVVQWLQVAGIAAPAYGICVASDRLGPPSS